MIAVVSHDAGGAEVLSSYVHRNCVDALYAVDGPARSIFQRKLGDVVILPLSDALDRCTSILSGTSWQSELEFDALVAARDRALPSAAFLDHWVNYRERFERNGQTCLPDEIWAGDADAYRLAMAAFPGTRIKLLQNPYFEDVREELARASLLPRRTLAGIAVLYVAEPLREHALRQFGDERYWGYTEEDALRFLLTNLGAIGGPVERVMIRPHPSELSDKYDWAEREFSVPIERSGGRTLVEEIAEADVVVGCESMALVVALIAGKRVVSAIPPGGRPCALPQREIEHLHMLRKLHGQIAR